MSSVASLRSDSQSAQREGDIIEEHEQLGSIQPVSLNELSDRTATEIHIGPRLGEKHAVTH
jgi:hypothetical protein